MSGIGGWGQRVLRMAWGMAWGIAGRLGGDEGPWILFAPTGLFEPLGLQEGKSDHVHKAVPMLTLP